MSFIALTLLALKLSVGLLVFAIGLRTNVAQLLYLFRQPLMLLRATLAMCIIMPVIAAFLVHVFDLRASVGIALMAIAISPVPPLMPRGRVKQGHEGYAVSLVFAMALIALVSIPLMLDVLERTFHTPLAMSWREVARVLAASVFLPLGLGVAVHWLVPKFAEQAASAVSLVAGAIMPLAAFVILVVAWRAVFAELTDGGFWAIFAFVALGLGVGYVLGGPDEADRAVLSLCTASRHPGMAIALAHANFPEVHEAAAAVLLYVIVRSVLSFIYLKGRHYKAVLLHQAND